MVPQAHLTLELTQPLSPRERQILAMLDEGKTRKEVAYDLAIACSTVRVLYSRAMRKLGGASAERKS
jgi:DNA-binding NarL/FixJ family response regulator